MVDWSSSAEFLGTDAPSRIKRCRELAAAAQALAASATDQDMQAGYLDLSRQWNALADDIARSMLS